MATDERFLDWLAAMAEGDRRALARDATRRARARGLVVLRPGGDEDIPLSLTPVVASASELARRGHDARGVLSAVVKTARHVLSRGLDDARARLLFGHFGPLEARCLANWREAEDVTIARVDWFVDAAGRHHALELNATIPAMQAYSDAAAEAWIETVGRAAGIREERVAELVAKNGSNAEQLRRSILAHARATGDRPSIAILHRPGDSQVRELEALAARFREAGHRVRLAVPDDVALEADRRVTVGGEAFDVLYRHIFARRMPENSALADIALGGTAPALQNPINGQLEVKGLFAELSRLAAEDDGRALGLSGEESEIVRRVVPWTRLFEPGPAIDPDRARVPDLVARVAAEPRRFVVKRSWDYGGKSVFIGRDVVRSEGEGGWRKRLDEALADGPGAFVVQELVDAPRQRHCVVGEDGRTTFEEVFVDASTYAATGERDVPGGSVARYARQGIVNIVGGGGVAPLVVDEVADEVARALATAA